MSEDSAKDNAASPSSRPESATPSRPSQPAIKPKRVIKLGQSSPPSRPNNNPPSQPAVTVTTSRPPAPVRKTPSSTEVTVKGAMPPVAPLPQVSPAPPQAPPPTPVRSFDESEDEVVTGASSSLPPKVYSSAPPLDGAKRASTPPKRAGSSPSIKAPPSPPLRSSPPSPSFEPQSSAHLAPTSVPSVSVEEEPVSVEDPFETEVVVEEDLNDVSPESAKTLSDRPPDGVAGTDSAKPPQPAEPGVAAPLSGFSPEKPEPAPPLRTDGIVGEGVSIPEVPGVPQVFAPAPVPVKAPIDPAITSAKPEVPKSSSSAGEDETSAAPPPPPSLAAKSPRRMPVPPSRVQTSGEGTQDVGLDLEISVEAVAPEFEVPAADRKPPPPRRSGKPSLPQAKKPRPKPWWETLFGDDFQRAYRPMSESQIKREVDFIIESYQLPRGSVLLDLGCGQGELCIELTRRGYSVVGYDLSVYQLAMAGDNAQQAGQKINFLQGDMREMAFDNMFDGILCWDTSFGYFEEDKNLEVLRRMRQALKPGGKLMLDILNRDFVSQQAPYSHWFEGDGCVCMDDMNMDWITNRLKVKRSIILDDGRSKELQYSIRLYSLSDIGRMLHEAGFRVAAVSGGVATRGAFFGPVSRRIIIEANKP